MTTNQYPFGITNDMIAAGKSVLAMAHEQLVRPIVEGYEARILEETTSSTAMNGASTASQEGDRTQENLMDKDDFQAFIELTYQARDAHNLKVSGPDNCPLLEAEYLRMQAENKLFQQVAKLPGMESLWQSVRSLWSSGSKQLRRPWVC